MYGGKRTSRKSGCLYASGIRGIPRCGRMGAVGRPGSGRTGLAAAALAAIAIAWPAGPARAEPLKTAAEQPVPAPTFEIVVPRIPEAASIQYERPLPWDKVPFSIRNDPYFS